MVGVQACLGTYRMMISSPQICREQFVALHSEPILKDLAEFWELKFGGLKYVELAIVNVKVIFHNLI